MLKIDFVHFESLDKNIKKVIKKAINASMLQNYSLTISLVDDETMLSLQRDYKNKDYITDVLSFPLPESELGFLHTKNILGDIVISLNKAKEQATKHNHSLLEELLVLSVHGFFHLLGYDHEINEEEAQKQMQGEMWLLDCVGFNPVLSLIGRVN